MFENIGKKIVGVGKGVMRGTQNFSETVSLNARIDECKRNLNNCYSQLGQAYYNRTQNNVPPEYKGIFDQIQMLNQTIFQLQEQIKVIKGIRQCPNCGAEVPNNVMFCGNCGYSMPPVQNPAFGGPVCPSCGAPLEEEALFCTNCGTRVVRQQEQNFSGGYGGPAPQPEHAGKTCPNCGSHVPADAAFCNECGASLLAAEQPQPGYSGPIYGADQPVQPDPPVQNDYVPQEPVMTEEPAAAEQQEQYSYQDSAQDAGAETQENPAADPVCPNCGTKLEEGAVFCSECGYRVG